MNRIVRLAEAETGAVDGTETEERRQSTKEPRMPDAEIEAQSTIDADTPAVMDPMHLRIVEALLFAAAEPLDANNLAAALPPNTNVEVLLGELQRHYQERGVHLVKVAEKWQFRTAKDLGFLLHKEKIEERRLSRAAIETLAIIAYHQPVTRAEIEDIRGVMVSKGTVDTLMEVGWVRIRGRRRTPGRPVTYGTTEAFQVHFGLESISDLPGMDELKAAGFLESLPPYGFNVPNPSDAFASDEDPYEGEEEDLLSHSVEADEPLGDDAP